MLKQIIKKIDRQLEAFLKKDKLCLSLSKTEPFLYRQLSRFVLNKGKRIRPVLFVMAYDGLAVKKTKNIYKTAIAFELLHDFFLVHDDIIDRSDLRRGKPSVHKALGRVSAETAGLGPRGNDLAIIAGDILFSLALKSFLSSEAFAKNALRAFNRFIDCSFYTELGEYIELLESMTSIEKIKKAAIYRIYELKTAKYTFSYPLSIGAKLASAPNKTIKALYECGTYIGTAFQIHDDILGLFADEKKSGKCSLSDLNEAKKTLLIWRAFQAACAQDKKEIKSLFNKPQATAQDLQTIRRIVESTGSLAYAKKEINRCFSESQKILSAVKMKHAQKKELSGFMRNVLGV